MDLIERLRDGCVLTPGCWTIDEVATDALMAEAAAALEAARAEVAEWKRVAAAQAELHGEAEAHVERLVGALREARQIIRDLLPDMTFAKWDALLRDQESAMDKPIPEAWQPAAVNWGVKTCYQCDRPVTWLAPDSRCVDCTRLTPDEVGG